MADYKPRRELEARRLERERTGITEEMEALSAYSAKLRHSTAENVHNFQQLEEADFPGSVEIEVVFRTYKDTIAKLAKIIGLDVEMYERDRPKHTIVLHTLRGYPIHMSHVEPQPWYPPESFALGSTVEMALTEKGKVHVMEENCIGARGCLVVGVKDFLQPPGTVENPRELSTEFSFHLHQLTGRVLDEAGIEYIPFEPAAGVATPQPVPR